MSTIYAATSDGYVRHESTTSWNTVHDATIATIADSNDTSTGISIESGCIIVGRTTTYHIRRAYFLFDTSGISVAPSAATLKIYGLAHGLGGVTTGDVIAIEGTWLGVGALGTGDFDSFTGFTSGWGSGNVTAYSSELSSWSTSGYNDITLNSTALAKMASGNTLSVILMNHTYDYSDATPQSGRSCNREINGLYWADSLSGTSPYIDYTPVGYGHDVLGVDSGDISKVVGVATADIDTVIGVD